MPDPKNPKYVFSKDKQTAKEAIEKKMTEIHKEMRRSEQKFGVNANSTRLGEEWKKLNSLWKKM